MMRNLQKQSTTQKKSACSISFLQRQPKKYKAKLSRIGFELHSRRDVRVMRKLRKTDQNDGKDV